MVEAILLTVAISHMELVPRHMVKDLMEVVTDRMEKAKDRTEIIMARMVVVMDHMLTNTAVVTVRNLTDTKLKVLYFSLLSSNFA